MAKKYVKKTYCCVTHHFPDRALVLFLLIHDHEKLTFLYPVGPIYNSIADIISDGRYFGSLTSGQDGLRLSQDALILPVRLEKLYPLEKRFWMAPQLNYSQLDRLDLISKAAANYSFFKLVVTPFTPGKKTLFMSAFTYYVNSSEKIIETFMLKSNFPVDPKAKYAAIYKFEKGMHLNWTTGAVSQLRFTQIVKSLN